MTLGGERRRRVRFLFAAAASDGGFQYSTTTSRKRKAVSMRNYSLRGMLLQDRDCARRISFCSERIIFLLAAQKRASASLRARLHEYGRSFT